MWQGHTRRKAGPQNRGSHADCRAAEPRMTAGCFLCEHPAFAFRLWGASGQPFSNNNKTRLLWIALFLGNSFHCYLLVSGAVLHSCYQSSVTGLHWPGSLAKTVDSVAGSGTFSQERLGSLAMEVLLRSGEIRRDSTLESCGRLRLVTLRY